jgi:hypothetical protein
MRIKKSISYTTYYKNQKEMAEDLGIKNSSKKAIEARCRVMGYEPEFD